MNPDHTGGDTAAVEKRRFKGLRASMNAGTGYSVGSRRDKRSCPPYNPGLQRLVDDKQAWMEPLDSDARSQGFLGWHQRGYLPHFDAPGVKQLVTFRLHDAMPGAKRSEWGAMLRLEESRERRRRLEEYLDRGMGECWLRRPAVASIAENALRFFDGERYRLEAWVVMPNHVHAVVEIWQVPLARLVHTWKGHIAREANKVLGRVGPFWEREYWDTLIRSETHCARSIRYVEENPVKAHLVRTAAEWAWSSARFRDEYCRLPMSSKRPSQMPPSNPDQTK